jgi:probable phosphoglycerate mutase
MTRLAVLRHGPTAWNAEGRIQGRADIPLSAAGAAALRGLTLPAPVASWATL